MSPGPRPRDVHRDQRTARCQGDQRVIAETSVAQGLVLHVPAGPAAGRVHSVQRVPRRPGAVDGIERLGTRQFHRWPVVPSLASLGRSDGPELLSAASGQAGQPALLVDDHGAPAPPDTVSGVLPCLPCHSRVPAGLPAAQVHRDRESVVVPENDGAADDGLRFQRRLLAPVMPVSPVGTDAVRRDAVVLLVQNQSADDRHRSVGATRQHAARPLRCGGAESGGKVTVWAAHLLMEAGEVVVRLPTADREGQHCHDSHQLDPPGPDPGSRGSRRLGRGPPYPRNGIPVPRRGPRTGLRVTVAGIPCPAVQPVLHRSPPRSPSAMVFTDTYTARAAPVPSGPSRTLRG